MSIDLVNFGGRDIFYPWFDAWNNHKLLITIYSDGELPLKKNPNTALFFKTFLFYVSFQSSLIYNFNSKNNIFMM